MISKYQVAQAGALAVHISRSLRAASVPPLTARLAAHMLCKLFEQVEVKGIAEGLPSDDWEQAKRECEEHMRDIGISLEGTDAAS